MTKNIDHPTIRIGKLYSKLPNQNQLIHVEHYIPQKTAQKNHGTLFFVIAIEHANKESQKTIDSIVETAINHFYKNLDDTLNSFELCLRYVNEKLADLAEEGKTQWIGNLHSLIAVIKEDQIHITQTGSAEAYLIRNKIISHITEGLSEKNDEKHPLNTYINISSGQLNIGDRVVMSTEQLYNNISLDRLRRLAIQHNPVTCVAEIARILAQENIRSIGTIVIEATTEEKLAKEDVKPQPEEVILQEKKFQGSKFSEVVSQSQDTYQKVSDWIKNLLPKKKSSSLKIDNSKNSRRQPKEPPKEKISNITRPAKSIPIKSSNSSINILQKINAKTPNKQIIVIGLIILFTITLGIGITYLRNKQNITNKQNAVMTKINDAQSLITQADNALIIADKTNAKNKYSQALEILNSIQSSPYYNENIVSLTTKLKTNIDNVDNIVRVDTSKPLTDLASVNSTNNSTPSKFSLLWKINENLYSFSKNIASINISSGKITNITGFDITNLVGATLINSNAELAFYQNSQMQKFNPSGNTLQDLSTLDPAWKPAVDISSYYNNLYFLSPKENQIFKYSTLGGNDYSAASSYISDASNIDLSNAVSITIDGSVFILKKDGAIIKSFQGDTNNYELKNIPEPYSKLSNPNQIYTEENLDYIYISDPGNKRILEFKKETGEYIKQFVGEKLGHIDNFTINSKIKTIYILSDNKIYTVNS